MGRKGHNKDRENSASQTLKAENKLLKRQISRLQKLLARIDDPTRIQQLTELVDAQRREDKELHEDLVQSAASAKWKCFKCEEGTIKLLIFNRADGVFYFRRCAHCGNKTRLKKYHQGVQE